MVDIYVARDITRHDVFEVHRPAADALRVALGAIHPQESAALKLKLAPWVRHALADTLSAIQVEITRSLGAG